jgi:hypothetical protein
MEYLEQRGHGLVAAASTTVARGAGGRRNARAAPPEAVERTPHGGLSAGYGVTLEGERREGCCKLIMMWPVGSQQHLALVVSSEADESRLCVGLDPWRHVDERRDVYRAHIEERPSPQVAQSPSEDPARRVPGAGVEYGGVLESGRRAK